ncbi:MAG: sulfotransferase family protein, partial [Phycisphaerales bacterium JB038]
MNPADQLAQGVFFIVGTGRSGTTLLQAMLASHPRLAIPPETKFFQRWDPAEKRFGGEPLTGARLDGYLEQFFDSED